VKIACYCLPAVKISSWIKGAKALALLSVGLSPSLGWIAYSRSAVPYAAQVATQAEETTLPHQGQICSRGRCEAGALLTDPHAAATLEPLSLQPRFVADALPIFDLEQPSALGRLDFSPKVRVVRRGRKLALKLPQSSSVRLPELLCAPTYRAFLRLEVEAEEAMQLTVAVEPAEEGEAAPPGAAPSGSTLLRRLTLEPGRTTAYVALPHILQPAQPSAAAQDGRAAVSDSMGHVVLRCAEGNKPCVVRSLEIRGLSPADSMT
jgi:hypothetical protein